MGYDWTHPKAPPRSCHTSKHWDPGFLQRRRGQGFSSPVSPSRELLTEAMPCGRACLCSQGSQEFVFALLIYFAWVCVGTFGVNSGLC